MKNKLTVLSILGLAMFIAGSASAASSLRGAKAIKMLQQTTTPNAIVSGPATVYAVILGTGAVTDYIVLFDSANYTTATGVIQGSTFRGRYMPTSATAITQITFDPPLLFKNGITAVNAAALTPNSVVYQAGIATSSNQ